MTCNWHVQDRFLELRSRWLTIVGEHCQTPDGEQLEYWRVEKADSVIILPIHERSLIVLPPTYRHGIAQATIDFPGGRRLDTETPIMAAQRTLCRELDIPSDVILDIHPLNTEGWIVNSAFSNQRLYGFVGRLAAIPPHPAWQCYPISDEGMTDLLRALTCLQCRALLLEWLLEQRGTLGFSHSMHSD